MSDDSVIEETIRFASGPNTLCGVLAYAPQGMPKCAVLLCSPHPHFAGDMDNNVHPAGTMRLVDALIKANKRFDMLILPGKRHGYGNYSGYFTQKTWEFFAEHLLGDHQSGADIGEKV